jgi:predicted GIY-YIG superfamily endonuclease
MSFWAYMLHCRGGYFYTGHTDDLDRRIADHKSGLIPGFTADHQPVELVWSQDFVTRDEAKASERQIKGWSRAKKLALIRGDWERISALAKGKSGPSTSSGKTGLGSMDSQNSVHPDIVEGLSCLLHHHPQSLPLAVSRVQTKWRIIGTWLQLRWRIEGARKVLIAPFTGRRRANGLWQSTCFEMFVQPISGAGYAEFNFSPSEAYAAYDFTSWREGMGERALSHDPVITPRGSGDVLIVDVAIPLSDLPALPAALSLTCVIEEEGGAKSYWAMAHGDPDKPDFHDPACFAAMLAAPEAP